jgi:hypothetical protein
MTFRTVLRSALLILFCLLFAGPRPAAADSSHARIVRLSLVQGDVRFTRDAHGDALTDQKAAWETAILNLPIRQGYVVATDNGRAEVEFENGAMAFLNEHSVLEFYDLSRNDGDVTTRLVLRQGTASFYVHPGSGDYFSVTGGDFTVEAASRTSFRLDNFDDGSTVSVQKGHLTVLHKAESTPLEKGQSLAMHGGEENTIISRLPEDDDFDRWVSGRIDSVSTATNAALQYTNSPYYTSGFGDLSTYGSWLPVGGYGYGWRPFGMGFGWSPFDSGSWFFDSAFGWSFIGFQPWGWTPYHFGGWIYSPAYGWVWVPSGFGYGRGVSWHPVTAVFVRSGGKTGIVPLHPADGRGKTPINITHGVMPVSGRGDSEAIAATAGDKWKVSKTPPRGALISSLAAAAPPTRVSRTVLAGTGGSRAVTVGRDSSISYDPREHRFVNNNAPPASTTAKTETQTESVAKGGVENASAPARVVAKPSAPGAIVSGNAPAVPPAIRASTPPPPTSRASTPPPPARASITPPPARSSGGSGGSRGGEPARGSGGSRPAGPSSAPRSAPPPAPHPSPAPSGRPH